MGRYTPKMTDEELATYLVEHLVKELQWLLRAATEWHVQETLNLGKVGYEVHVFAMDSAFLHARTLFEFLTRCTSNNYYGCNAFGIAPQVSDLYDGEWCNQLHAALMHAQDRSQKVPLESFDLTTTKPLHKMPVDFAKEVVRLWRDFAMALGRHSRSTIEQLEKVAHDGLEQAVRDAELVASSEMATQHNVTIPAITWY